MHPECKIISVEDKEMDVLEWIQAIDVAFEISKEVQVVADVTGVPYDGHYILSVDVEPHTVYVNGTKETLVDTDKLYTESVDVTDERASVSLRKYIIVPGGLRISSNSSAQAVVNVSIDKYRHLEVYISKSSISLINSDTSGDYIYEIANNEIPIIVRGKRNDMSEFDPESVSALVNVEALRPGTSSRPLIVKLPDGITLVGTPLVDVIVSDVNAQVPADQNGANGANGANGVDGANGDDGANGAGGAEGATSAEGVNGAEG
jgi:YbbR domain-containing protein